MCVTQLKFFYFNQSSRLHGDLSSRTKAKKKKKAYFYASSLFFSCLHAKKTKQTIVFLQKMETYQVKHLKHTIWLPMLLLQLHSYSFCNHVFTVKQIKHKDLLPTGDTIVILSEFRLVVFSYLHDSTLIILYTLTPKKNTLRTYSL